MTHDGVLDRGTKILEDVDNPFLDDFYKDKRGAAFRTELFFVLSRYDQQRQVAAHTVEHPDRGVLVALAGLDVSLRLRSGQAPNPSRHGLLLRRMR